MDSDLDDVVYANSNEPTNEICQIDNALDDVQKSMSNYINNVNSLWHKIIHPFIQSTDCVTLGKLTSYDYDKFLGFMMKQNTYRMMEISFNDLLKRKEYIRPKED